jgi:hypothetical protein
MWGQVELPRAEGRRHASGFQRKIASTCPPETTRRARRPVPYPGVVRVTLLVAVPPAVRSTVTQSTARMAKISVAASPEARTVVQGSSET